MALRLRRGTDAQRLLIVPAEGELIYTTDTKRLYVGDGSTAGGVLVNTADAFSIGDLSDVDLGSGPGFGQVLKWDGFNFVPSDDIGEGIVGSGVTEGSNYRINILGDDSSILVNTVDNSFTGKLYGDVWDFISDEKVIDGDNRLAKVDITTDADVTILQHNTSNYYDPSGNLLIDGGLRAFFGDVDGSIRGSVYNTDLSVAIVNHLTGQLTGDLKGSVFGDDSSVLVDAINGTITGLVNGVIDTDQPAVIGKNRNATGRAFTVYSNAHLAFGSPVATIINTGDTAVANELNLLKTRGTPDAPTIVQTGDTLGSLSFSAFDGTSNNVAASIRTTVGAVSAGSIESDLCFYVRNGAIGTYMKRAELGSTGIWQADRFSSLTQEAFTVESFMTLVPMSAAPTTPTAGMVAVDDGSNWSGVATNGTDETLVIYLNSAWVKVA